MVHFKDYHNYLAVLSSKDDKVDEGILFPVDRAIFGRYSPISEKFVVSPALEEWTAHPTKTSHSSHKAQCLQSHLHDTARSQENFITLGSRIISGEAIWGQSFEILGEFTYIPKYWEWTEDVLFRCSKYLSEINILDAVYASLYTYDRDKDVIRAFCENWCPATNTLHLAFGEASISLWDLHRLGGLPLHGMFYDEVIPSASELTGEDDKGRFLPKCCEYLFAAYHFLSDKKKFDGKVLAEDWVNFWFRGDLFYQSPPVRRGKRTHRPRLTHNPDGSTKKRQSWNDTVAQAFIDLGVEDSEMMAVYLAAFLSCWLCIFVFPSGDPKFIRPETFKIASIMAVRRKVVNLAVPVLACIYHGLNKIATSTYAGSSDACFPVHYVYGWLSHYFDTYFPMTKKVVGPWMVDFSGEGGAKPFNEKFARKFIHTNISWDVNLFSKNRDILIDDNAALNGPPYNYFISTRSSYLPVRCNNGIIIEPYSPHRFARQLGFCQSVPGVLKKDIRTGSIDDLIRLWRSCAYRNSKCRLTCPARPLDINNHATGDFMEWWTKIHDVNYLEYDIDILISSTHKSKVPTRKKKNAPTRKPLVINLGKAKVRSEVNVAPQDESSRAPDGNVIEEVQGLDDSTDETDQDHHWKRSSRKKQKVFTPSDPIALDDIPSFSTLPDRIDALLQDQDLSKEVTHEASPVGSEVSVSNSHEFDRALERIGIPASQPVLHLTEGLVDNSPNIVVDEAHKQVPEHSLPAAPEVSRINVDRVIYDCHAKLVMTLWQSIQPKLARTPFNQLSLIEADVQKILSAMEEIKSVDSSSLRSMIQEYFARAKSFDDIKFSFSSRLSADDKTKELQALEVRFRESHALEDNLRSELSKATEEIKDLEDRKRKLESFVQEREEALQKTTADTSQIRSRMSFVESVPVLTEGEVKSLEVLQSTLESSREELKNFKWKA